MAEGRRFGGGNNNCLRYYNASNDENYQVSWRQISEKIIYLLKRGPKIALSFEPLYSQIYRTICSGKSEKMYLDLISLCSRHLSEVEQSLCPPDEVSLEHLLGIIGPIKDYIDCIKKITLIFSYLNKNYVARNICSDLFTELAALFNQTILQQRMPALMIVAEEALKVPCSISPTFINRFFNDVRILTNREYAVQYPHLFSRYCMSNLPDTKNRLVENQREEILEYQEEIRNRLEMRKMQWLRRVAEQEF